MHAIISIDEKTAEFLDILILLFNYLKCICMHCCNRLD